MNVVDINEINTPTQMPWIQPDQVLTPYQIKRILAPVCNRSHLLLVKLRRPQSPS